MEARKAGEGNSKSKDKVVQIEHEDANAVKVNLEMEAGEASKKLSNGKGKAVQMEEADEVAVEFSDDEILEMKPSNRFKRTATDPRVYRPMRRSEYQAEESTMRNSQQPFQTRNTATRDERPVPQTTMVDTSLDKMRFSTRRTPEPLIITTGQAFEFW